jgi:transposase InsO family protein
MDASFCMDCLEEALVDHGKPDIFNTDQGSQFTSVAFTRVLKREGVDISMDGGAVRWTTSSSNACGATSSTRMCT